VGNGAPALGTNVGFGGGLLNRNGAVDVNPALPATS